MTGQIEGEQSTVESKDSDITSVFSYIALAHDPESSESHFVIATSSTAEREVFACRTNTHEENFASQFEEQARVQNKLCEIIFDQ